MNLDKLQEETARLRLEVERCRSNWERFLRRALLLFAYLVIVSLALIYVLSASSSVVLTVIVAFLLWETGEGVKLQLELRSAINALQSWKQTINLANQEIE
jgi:hypothetical protein